MLKKLSKSDINWLQNKKHLNCRLIWNIIGKTGSVQILLSTVCMLNFCYFNIFLLEYSLFFCIILDCKLDWVGHRYWYGFTCVVRPVRWYEWRTPIYRCSCTLQHSPQNNLGCLCGMGYIRLCHGIWRYIYYFYDKSN